MELLIVSDLVVCGASYHTGVVPLFDMRPHKLDQIQLAVPHTDVVFLLYLLKYLSVIISNNQSDSLDVK